MKVAIITDSFPPLINSGAIQIRDLSIEFVRQGHEVLVITPSSEIDTPYLLSEMGKVQILMLKVNGGKILMCYTKHCLMKSLLKSIS